MSPLANMGDAERFFGGTGKFFKISELAPGQSIQVQLVDIVENHKISNPKYAIKGTDYNYRLSFIDPTGSPRIWDLNGADAIRQALACLYPEGRSKPMQPGVITLTRRPSRSTTQSEAQMQRLVKGT